MGFARITLALDQQTIARIERAAARLRKSKSAIVRDAVREYSERVGHISEQERLRRLRIIDKMLHESPYVITVRRKAG